MTLFTLRGIPIRLHLSFLVLAGGYILFQLVQGGALAASVAALMGLALFGSVALHELGHALAARHFDIRTRSITLYPFGGVAALEREAMSAAEELVIAVAGPAVNLLLAALAAPLWWAGSAAAGVFAALNLGMALFNLLPAFPMDGGRVLRAAMSLRMGYFPATRAAIRVGRLFAWGFIILGFMGNPSLVFIGGFMLVATRAEEARLQQHLRRASHGGPGPNAHRMAWAPPRAEVLRARHWDHPAV